MKRFGRIFAPVAIALSAVLIVAAFGCGGKAGKNTDNNSNHNPAGKPRVILFTQPG